MPFIKRISFPGFIVGSIVDIVASNIWGVIAMVYVLAHYQLTSQLGQMSAEELTAQVLSIFKTDPLVFGTNLVCGGLCSILGGYVGAWIAKHDEVLNGALSSILCVASGIWGLASGAYTGSFLLAALSLLLNPALCAFGGYLRWLQNYRKRISAADA